MIAALLVLGVIILIVALLLRSRSALAVAGALIYSDTDKRAITAPINSHKSRLTGKPDYVYRVKNLVVPVEVKKHRPGRFGPRASDVAQLMAYCVILEDNGATVTHGLVEYPDKRISIAYGPEERRRVLEAAEVIRAERRFGAADRSHDEAWRCRSCGVRASCGQVLGQS